MSDYQPTQSMQDVAFTKKWIDNAAEMIDSGKQDELRQLHEFLQDFDWADYRDVAQKAASLGLSIANEGLSVSDTIGLCMAAAVAVSGNKQQIKDVQTTYELFDSVLAIGQSDTHHLYELLNAQQEGRSLADAITSRFPAVNDILEKIKIGNILPVFNVGYSFFSVTTEAQKFEQEKGGFIESGLITRRMEVQTSVLSFIGNVQGLIPVIGMVYGSMIDAISDMVSGVVDLAIEYNNKLINTLDAIEAMDPSSPNYKDSGDLTGEYAATLSNQVQKILYYQSGLEDLNILDDVTAQLRSDGILGPSGNLLDFIKARMQQLFPDADSALIRGILSDPSSILDLVNNAGNQNAYHVDPLVLDLGGMGFTITDLDKGAHFDLDGDGFAQRTNWVSGRHCISNRGIQFQPTLVRHG
jgi:hypothetical protein